MRRTVCRATVLAALVLMALAVAPAPSAADLVVFVGYSDNLRPSGFFPTPWIGAPGVVSETGAQTFDAGAIRIDNTGGSAVNITGFTVTFPTGPVFSIWAPLLIPAGGTGIFTQTVSFNFDTSDFGIFGGLPPADLSPLLPGNNLIGGCSSAPSILNASAEKAACDATIPVITFLADGVPQGPFSDTGHILDTGEWDFVNNGVFGEDGNESINWNLVGSQANRGGTVPEPSSLLLLGSGLVGLAGLALKPQALRSVRRWFSA